MERCSQSGKICNKLVVAFCKEIYFLHKQKTHLLTTNLASVITPYAVFTLIGSTTFITTFSIMTLNMMSLFATLIVMLWRLWQFKLSSWATVTSSSTTLKCHMQTILLRARTTKRPVNAICQNMIDDNEKSLITLTPGWSMFLVTVELIILTRL